MNAAAALGAAAALLAYAHPPSPMDPDGPLVAEKFVSPAAAMKAFLGDATGVVAFGELHQTVKTAGVRSSIARFTDEILPAIAPRASHLIVETWVSRGACGETEKQVTKDVARTTERPAETENEIVRLLRRAKELGVAPHVLDVDCHEYQSLVARGRRRRLRPAADDDRPAPRPRDRAGAGAAAPGRSPAGARLRRRAAQRSRAEPALANYSFGPAIDALTHGDYREVDLLVPELVDTTPALRAERWYPVWRKARAAPGTTLIRRQPRSAVLVFEDQDAHRKTVRGLDAGASSWPRSRLRIG